jgi:hypothetical protein
LTIAASLIKNSTIMKNWILVTGLVILGSGYSLAQGRPAEAAQRVRAMKVAFITERMNLTPEEAEKFWPLQKAFEAEQRICPAFPRRKSNDSSTIFSKWKSRLPG